MRHYKIRHYNSITLKRHARIKIMQTILKPVSHLSLFCTHTRLFSGLASFGFITPLFYTLPSFRFFMFTISQVFLVNPKMMSNLILLCHTDLRPVILVLLPQPTRIQHLSTDTQLDGAYSPFNLDGFVSPCHPHAVTQICH